MNKIELLFLRGGQMAPIRDRDDNRRWNKTYRETMKPKRLNKFKKARLKSVWLWKHRNPEKNRAYSTLHRALDKGDIKKHKCLCGASKDTVKANFIDYENMIFVFLCPKCSVEFNRCRIDDRR